MTTAVSTLNSSLLARIQAKRKEIKSKTNRVDIIRPAAGKHKYRILPNKVEGDFWADFGRHYVKDEAGKMAAVYVCVEHTFGKPCAVCQEIAKAGKYATDDAQLKVLEESRCKRADTLINVLVRNDPSKANTPQVMALAPSVMEQFLGLYEAYAEEGIDMLSLKDGIDITIERDGTGLNTKYTVQAAVKSSPVDAAVMEQTIDLQEFVQQESEADMRKALNAVNAVVGILDMPVTAAVAAPAAVSAAIAAPRTSSKPAVTATATATATATDDLSDDDLDSLIEDGEFTEMKATGTDGAAPFTPSAPSAASSDMDIDALLGELDNI